MTRTMRFNPVAVCTALSLLCAASVVSADGAKRIDGGRQPQAATAPDGSHYVVYAKDGAVYCAAAPAGGEGFSPPVRVGEPRNMSVGMRRGPRVAAADGAIIVTAISGERGGGKDGDVTGWRSQDAGKTWLPLEAPLNSASGAAREGLHGMAAGPGGRVFCVWLDLRNAERGGGTEIWGTRSHDAGRTWSADFLVYRSPAKSVCQCCHPSVAYGHDGKTVAVMFRNELSGARDMYLVTSSDGGKTFNEGQKLGEGTWSLKACPMDGGMLAFPTKDGADPLTAWRREFRVYTARPGTPERFAGDGQQPWVAAGAGGSFVVWIAGRPGDLFLSQGEAARPVKLAERASDPSVAAGNDGAVVAWEQDGGVMTLLIPTRR